MRGAHTEEATQRSEAEADADRERWIAIKNRQQERYAEERRRRDEETAQRSTEQVITPVEFGRFWRRFFALLIDSIIIAIIGTVIAFITGISGYLLPFVVAVLYFTISFSRGRTLGKAILGLRVMNLDGDVPNFRRAFLRSLPLAILLSSTEIGEGLPQIGYPLNIAMNIVVGGIGVFVFLALLITVISHPQKRGIHDIIAGTVCVKVAASPQLVSPVKIGMKLRIALLVIAVASVAVGTVPAILSGTGPEHPAIVSWRSEGLVERVELLSHSWRSPELSFSAVEVRAVVPTGTLADEAKTKNIQSRLLRDSTFIEADILVIKLIERKRFGFFTTSKFTWTAYPAVGKEHIMDQAGDVLPMLIMSQ